MSDFLDKVRSIGTPRGRQTQKVSVDRDSRGAVRTTEHADGRVDVAVQPNTVRYAAEDGQIVRKEQ